MEEELFDYPPHIKVCARRKAAAVELEERSSCELQVLGLTRNIKLKLKLPTNCSAPSGNEASSPSLPPPLSCSSSSDVSSPLTTDGMMHALKTVMFSTIDRSNCLQKVMLES